MMLPNLLANYPTFEVEVPSTKEKLRVRPMLVKDEKILLTAKEGKAANETYVAIHNVVKNCLVTPNVDLKKLTSFDIEYLFLRVRAVSVGNVVDLVFTDVDDDDKQHNFKIDLDKVHVKFSDKKDGIDIFDIKMGNHKGIFMKYPPSSVYESKPFTDMDSSEEVLLEEMVLASLDKYYDGDKIVLFRDCPPAEIKEFINNLDIKTFGKIRDFIAEIPTLFHEVKYKNSKDEEKTLTLTSLMDFFAF